MKTPFIWKIRFLFTRLLKCIFGHEYGCCNKLTKRCSHCKYVKDEDPSMVKLVDKAVEEKIKPCPVCGKQPKVKRDIGYEISGFGAWCIIQCKPLLGKAHLKIEEGKSTWTRAYQCAVERWNKEALEGGETH